MTIDDPEFGHWSDEEIEYVLEFYDSYMERHGKEDWPRMADIVNFSGKVPFINEWKLRRLVRGLKDGHYTY
ncbi:MAG: hypothetical protein M1824_002425 [Vezdaea acicularis]|nr:MAG: hypothetical protein M1824_002425 [Vezdaea acicularis]